MYIKIARSVFAALLLGGSVFCAAAQEGLPIESDWDALKPSLYTRGDQTFVVGLGTIFPTVFFGEDGTIDNNINMGGTGYLNYNYFINSNVSIGGEVGGMFASTLGRNMIFIVPFGVKLGYQFVLNRFEFPLSVMIGGASQSYINEKYFGLIIKPGAAVYWRPHPEWSFGLNSAWWWTPQWVKEKGHDVYGNFLELTLSARYHF